MYTIGIEKEYFVFEKTSLELKSITPSELELIFGKNVKHEMLCCQIEINTSVCKDIAELEGVYQNQTERLYRCAEKHGLLLLDTSTPLVKNLWENYQINPSIRYQNMLARFRYLYHRALNCSFQIHVQPQHPQNRYPLINYLRSYLPLFLALSTSSPFWDGVNTGLMSYRSYLFHSLPNASLPPIFENMDVFNNHVQNWMKTDSILDEKMLWWDLRPHNTYPTIECRICDNVHELADVIAIAALYQALVMKIEQEFIKGAILSPGSYLIDLENKWRIARYGFDAEILDVHYQRIGCKDAILSLLDQLEPTMKMLGTDRKIQDIHHILQRGTSAHLQLKLFEKEQSLKPIIKLLGK